MTYLCAICDHPVGDPHTTDLGYLCEGCYKEEYGKMKITRQEFEAYREVQISGVVSMFNIAVVGGLTGLSREKILYIMQNYREQSDKYIGRNK